MKTIGIIGAGAAGCFLAANLLPKYKIIIWEKTSRPLQKVKVSGGGRCNVTHACFDVKQLLQYYPRGRRVLNKSLNRFSPQDTIQWFEERGVVLKTEKDGRMFPVTDNSQTIIDAIWEAINHDLVTFQFNQTVSKVSPIEGKQQWLITNHHGITQIVDYLVIATGGYPKLSMYEWMASLGIKIQAPVPSLFTFNCKLPPLNNLMGLSVSDAQVQIVSTKLQYKGPLLITHWGFSGPAILKLSAYGAEWIANSNYDFSIKVNWCNLKEEHYRQQVDSFYLHANDNFKMGSNNPFKIPQRLWHYLMDRAGVDPDKWVKALSKSDINKLVQVLYNDVYAIKGKTTFKEEFVTCGGIDLEQIEPSSLAFKQYPNLFAVGEALNVDGITGGFNFQNAWASAMMVANHLNQQM